MKSERRKSFRKKPSLSKFKFLATASLVAIVVTGMGLKLLALHNSSPETGINSPVSSPENTPSETFPLTESSTSATSSQIVVSPFIYQGKELIYNVTQPPNFENSQRLEEIVQEIVNLSAARNLPTDSLSITLIDINSGEFAEFNQSVPRYPASVVKLFWLTALYSQLASGIGLEDQELEKEIYQMMEKSDNEAASKIVDRLTGTESGEFTSEQEFVSWHEKRSWLNRFFAQAGYQDIYISQKTFPIPYLKYDSPEGLDQQMRGDDLQNPIRNQVTTEQVSRLIYEIVQGKSVSPQYSEKILTILKKDLRPAAWENIDTNIEFNPIRAFFGEYLPPEEVEIFSKAGWTSRGRQEVAYVKSFDGNVAYILAIFAEDSGYATDWKAFPGISRLVYDRMSK